VQQVIDAVLWDMDGTLADTGELHFQTWKSAMQKIGYDLTREKFTATFGMNNQDILERLLGKPPTPELVAAISEEKEGEYRRLLPGRVSLLPGIRDWLITSPSLPRDRFWHCRRTSTPLSMSFACAHILLPLIASRPQARTRHLPAGCPPPASSLTAAWSSKTRSPA
jgi:beta-phosphoglucomutase-like phosphatase (HAD superfamily)